MVFDAILAAIFVFTALDQFRRLDRPVVWAATLASFVAAFFLVGLFKIAGWENALAQRHFWAAGALAIGAALMALLVAFGRASPTRRTRAASTPSSPAR